MLEPSTPYWSKPIGDLLAELETSDKGLGSGEAARRLAQVGPNTLKPKRKTSPLGLLLGQFTSPITLILIAAALLPLFLRDLADALIILSSVLVSGLLGFWQERGAAGAVEKLLQMVEVQARALRDGNPVDVPVEAIVPGDVVLLSPGASIPGDCCLLDSKDLFLNEAALTGETYPVEKTPGSFPADTPLVKRGNTLFMGTHVVSGSGQALMVLTGKDTELGKVSERLKLRPPETDFEHGIRRFGYFLMSVTLILVILIFAVNVYLKRLVMDSFLFSLALAVGLTPQLLPAIISVNLSHGARRMADKQVIVKRLESIENFGSLDILCSDKTGTLTEGTVHVHPIPGLEEPDEEAVLRLAYLNACFQTGFSNPIDEALKTHRPFDLSGVVHLDEIPYDFVRKQLTVLVEDGDAHLMITKGALANVFIRFSELRAEGPKQKTTRYAGGSQRLIGRGNHSR
ncbi:MAG: HAD-IC family P-type ATPase [Chloroflexota bacterium]